MTETYKDQVCKDHPRVMVETYWERVCMTNTGRHCLMVWVVDHHGNKNFEEDPDNCHELPETVCEDQEKTRNKVVIEKKCKHASNLNVYMIRFDTWTISLVDSIFKCYEF